MERTSVESHTLLHLGDQVLVEQTSSLLVERAVDGHNIALSQHLLEILNTAAANLLLHLRLEGLVVEVQELLAVERLKAAEHTLTNATDGNGTNDLALKVELVLGHGGDVPVSAFDLLVGRHEVADEGEDGHDNVLSDGDDVAAGDFGNGDTAIGLVGGVQVNVVRANTGGDSNLQLLCLGQTLSSQVAGVEAVEQSVSITITGRCGFAIGVLRSGDDDFGINQFLVELGVLALLVRGSHQGVSLIFKPLSNTQLVLSGSEKAWLVFGMLMALDEVRCWTG